jgi:hypothetical protein
MDSNESARNDSQVANQSLRDSDFRDQTTAQPLLEGSNKVQSKLYNHCTTIINHTHNSLNGDEGWDSKGSKPAVHLREAALRLAHWQSSVRWCVRVAGRRSTKSRIIEEEEAHRMLASLENSGDSLAQTIKARIDNVLERIDDVIKAMKTNASTM